MARRSTRTWASLLALAGSHWCASARAEGAASGSFEAKLAQADQRFVAGDLLGALQLLGPVCTGSDRPECAFALGAIQHGLGHCAEALLHYRHYRQLAPDGEHRAEVDAALEEVESQCGGSTNTSAASLSPAHVQRSTSGTPFLMPGLSLAATSGAVFAAAPPSPGAPPAPDANAGSLTRALVFGSFALSGAAAATSLIFGVLAAHSASSCEHHESYDQAYIDDCEHAGPRYQGLWQGFAVASTGFLGVGLSLWWFEPDTSMSVAIAAGGLPALQLRQRF
jgi:hypothetical protein